MKPVLIISILFKNKGAVGGMAQRFSLLGDALISNGVNIKLLTTQSLKDEFDLSFSDKMTILNDKGKYLSMGSIFKLILTLFYIGLGRYRQVHLAGAGRLVGPVIWAVKFSKTRLSCTFASRTLEMASYGSCVNKRKWIYILNNCDKIDVLNPGHDLDAWANKISISPCSFPSKIKNLPNSYKPIKENLAVFCGALEVNKNPILAINIVDEYIESTGNFIEIVFFGKGVLYNEVVKNMNLINSKYQRNIAYFSDLKLGEVLSAANVFFSLQEIDNYPSQSLIEAMLMGCKVIATDEGDSKLMFPAEEKSNALVNSRRPSDFMPAMKNAFDNRNASEINFRYVRENHNLNNFANYFRDFIND